MVKPKRSALRLCVLDDGAGTPTLSHAEEISADDVDVVEQLFAVARGVESRLKGLSVDRVIVRRADVPTVASKKDAPRIRLLTEGAAVGAARAAIEDTRLAMGVELAHGLGRQRTIWTTPVPGSSQRRVSTRNTVRRPPQRSPASRRPSSRRSRPGGPAVPYRRPLPRVRPPRDGVALPLGRQRARPPSDAPPRWRVRHRPGVANRRPREDGERPPATRRRVRAGRLAPAQALPHHRREPSQPVEGGAAEERALPLQGLN